MLDARFIREHAEEVKANIENRHAKADVGEFIRLDAQRRELLQQVEALKSQRKPIDAECKHEFLRHPADRYGMRQSRAGETASSEGFVESGGIRAALPGSFGEARGCHIGNWTASAVLRPRVALSFAPRRRSAGSVFPCLFH